MIGEFDRALAISSPDRTLKIVAKALTEAGDTERALQVAETIEYKSSKSDALTKIAIVLAEAGKTDQALSRYTRHRCDTTR